MKHGSLFTGIGGFDLAATWMGWENVFQVEKNNFCLKVLEKNFPETKRYNDVRDFKGDEYISTIDVLSGGFPCKQTSVGAAIHGKRNGLQGPDSSLWWEQLRIIDTIKPRVPVIENVSGVQKWESAIQKGLESIGYTISRMEEASCYYGLPHVRKRYIYVAHRNIQRLEVTRQEGSPTTEWFERLAADGGSWLSDTPGIIGGFNGVPDRVDRIEAIGNAVSPLVALNVFKHIEKYYLNANTNI